jgi:hypothetical protein
MLLPQIRAELTLKTEHFASVHQNMFVSFRFEAQFLHLEQDGKTLTKRGKEELVNFLKKEVADIS